MTSRRSKSVLAVTTLVLAALPLVAHAKFKDAGDVDITFQAKGPAGMVIDGTSDRLTAVEKDGTITITVPVNSLKTGIGLRDRHLRGYLSAAECPNSKNLVLTVDRSKLKKLENDTQGGGKAVGTFEMNCVKKELKFDYLAKRTGSDYAVQAKPEQPINIKHYNVEIPCYLRQCVDPLIPFKAKFKLRDE
jgi:hypothetical protein